MYSPDLLNPWPPRELLRDRPWMSVPFLWAPSEGEHPYAYCIRQGRHCVYALDRDLLAGARFAALALVDTPAGMTAHLRVVTDEQDRTVADIPLTPVLPGSTAARRAVALDLEPRAYPACATQVQEIEGDDGTLAPVHVLPLHVVGDLYHASDAKLYSLYADEYGRVRGWIQNGGLLTPRNPEAVHMVEWPNCDNPMVRSARTWIPGVPDDEWRLLILDPDELRRFFQMVTSTQLTEEVQGL